MTVAYLNGSFLPLAEARISLEDRGLLFADAVYEVFCVAHSRAIDLPEHIDRLWRSLAALSMSSPCSRSVLLLLLQQFIRRNRLRNGKVYLQVSRGSARREHAFPPASCKPNLFMVATHMRHPMRHPMRYPKPPRCKSESSKPEASEPRRLTVISQPDQRWGRVDIKTTNLLANCLGVEAARSRGAEEVVFYDSASDVLHEASKSNLWMLRADNCLLTHPRTTSILGGVTRAVIMDIAASCGIRYLEEEFTRAQAYLARELFLTSSIEFVSSISELDGHTIGDGSSYDIARRLHDLYLVKLEKPSK